MNPIIDVIDQILNRSIGDIVGADYTMSVPSANVVENENNFQIILAAPGLEKSDFNIKVDKDHLFISAKKVSIQLPEGIKVKRKEFEYSNFSRNFFIPDVVDKNKVQAAYTDGLLTVTLQKRASEVETAKQIVIE